MLTPKELLLVQLELPMMSVIIMPLFYKCNIVKKCGQTFQGVGKHESITANSNPMISYKIYRSLHTRINISFSSFFFFVTNEIYMRRNGRKRALTCQPRGRLIRKVLEGWPFCVNWALSSNHGLTFLKNYCSMRGTWEGGKRGRRG